ncbi:MAG: hypothetical protein H7Y18_18150 [Clostridiaceae bacterium]|nr:hypothetical protein [Clostridiaceae bacterium]
MYNIKFMNTYNSVTSLREVETLNKPQDNYLQKVSCNTYLENNKILIHNYDNLKTECVLNNNLLFCYASINDYKILFNVLKLQDVSFIKNITTFNKTHLSALYKIDTSEILGGVIYYTRSDFPIEFKVINTCDCFNSYCKNNGIWRNKEARVNLISTFKESMATDLLADDPAEKISSINGNEFTYIYFYDLIIIIDHKKVITAI